MKRYMNSLTTHWQDGANLLLAIWLIASPSVLGYFETSVATWNAWGIGALVVITAFSALVAFRRWEEWLNIAFAAWLIASPWVFGFAGLQVAMWNHVAVGILIGALAIWSDAAEYTGHDFMVKQ